MSISLFNSLIGNKKYVYKINGNKLLVIKTFEYFIEENYTTEPWYTGIVSNDKIKLKKVKTKGRIPLDFSYLVFGKLDETDDQCQIFYRITFADYSLKHLSVCIIPSFMLLYIFLHYDSLYLFVPLIYYLLSDLIFNLRKLFFNKRNNNHFLSFLQNIEIQINKK